MFAAFPAAEDNVQSLEKPLFRKSAFPKAVTFVFSVSDAGEGALRGATLLSPASENKLSALWGTNCPSHPLQILFHAKGLYTESGWRPLQKPSSCTARSFIVLGGTEMLTLVFVKRLAYAMPMIMKIHSYTSFYPRLLMSESSHTTCRLGEMLFFNSFLSCTRHDTETLEINFKHVRWVCSARRWRMAKTTQRVRTTSLTYHTWLLKLQHGKSAKSKVTPKLRNNQGQESCRGRRVLPPALHSRGTSLR